LFLDVSGVLPQKLAFFAKIQFIPAVLSGSIAVVAALVLLTFLFGRIYCSAISPLGVLQDGIARLGKKRRYRFAPQKNWLRLGALAVFLLAFVAGFPLVFSLLEPYSAFGRIATDIAVPVWQFGSNLLAVVSARAENFAIGPTPVWQKGLPALIAALLSLGVIGVLALRSGRTWCNTLCPVGTLLGFRSRFALLRPRIDAKHCVNCGQCARNCKASCIDAQKATTDASRCVSCFNCLGTCRHDALVYALAGKQCGASESQASRRPDLPADRFSPLA